MKKVKYLLGVFAFTLLVIACNKDNTGTSGSKLHSYSVRLTDAPGQYDAVLVDIQSVEVTGDGKTIALNVNSGIYNLLNFTNGVDTLLATAMIDISKVEQIRLILGPNNSVMVDSVIYPLSTPSAQQSGLKLQVHQELQAGVNYSVTLDFDAARSVVYTGSNKYILKPVIRTVETALSGAISGSVSDTTSPVLITAVSASNDSFTTYTNSHGNFLLVGLPAGVYSITATPPSPGSPLTVTGVVVSVGITTKMTVITL